LEERINSPSAVFSPDGKKIVTQGPVSHDKEGANTIYIICIWDAETGKELKRMEGHHIDLLNFVTFSPDEKKIVSASMDGTARIWDAESGKALQLVTHNRIVPNRAFYNVRCVAFSPDGKKIITGSNDRTVRIWDLDRVPAVPPPLDTPAVSGF
jgi:WD40 repeat protein